MSTDTGLAHITTFLASIARAKTINMKEEELSIISK